MSLRNVKKLYKHFCYLSEGKFNERDFDFEVKGKNPKDEAGTIVQGKLTAERISLIKSDAIRHKIELERKFPQLIGKPKPISKPQETK